LEGPREASIYSAETSPDWSLGRISMYQSLSLLRLSELIALDGNRRALSELHDNRSVFYYHDPKPLRLAEFIDRLRESKPARRWCAGMMDVLDRAYDLTISKFSNIPQTGENVRNLKQKGPDCRYYYMAFVRHAKKKLAAESSGNEAEKEMKAASLLQRLVVRHFRLSCLECSRAGCGLMRRYAWKLNGSTLDVYMPVQIPGSECSKWLADNIPDVDPSRPGERERVQALVDRLAPCGKIVSLDRTDGNDIATDSLRRRSVTEHEIKSKGLAGAVADEKAANIEFQRPAIRRLGKAGLKDLVNKIFDGLAHGTYGAASIADEAGISRPTMSRFAGSYWLTKREDDRGQPIPDLWRNTAEALAGHSEFVRVAKSAGVWGRIQEVLAGGQSLSRLAVK